MMAYKVAVNTELANTWLSQENASAWLQAFLSTAQYITVFSVCSIYNCVFCVFLFKDAVFAHIVCGSSTLKSWPTTLKLMLWMEVDQCTSYYYSLVGHITDNLSCSLGTPESTVLLCWSHFKP